MRNLILEYVRTIMAGQEEGTPLPSIRAMATHFHCSVVTVNKALQELALTGWIHSMDRKGYFLGAAPATLRPLPLPVRNVHFASKLENDLAHGVFHPFEDLPCAKDLARLYQVSLRQIQTALRELETRGILVRKGRVYALPSASAAKPKSIVVLVIRCDADGGIRLDSDRELDFMKSLFHEAGDQKLSVRVVGWYQGQFLDSSGKTHPMVFPGLIVLGYILSTWLVDNPEEAVHALGKLQQPLAVWWEHPPERWRSMKKLKGPIAWFNLAFGRTPGLIVAEHALSHGLSKPVFLSPFHASHWSQERLAGIQEKYATRKTDVHTVCDTNCASWEHFLAQHTKHTVEETQEIFKQNLSTMFHTANTLDVDVWFCVNDMVAEKAHHWLCQENILHRPEIISFDHSRACFRYGFKSFHFHTEGMVRQMLFYICNPKAPLYQKHLLREMVGNIRD